MNIISSNQASNTVSLQQLIPQHDCLKLLILHTPYTLNISTLPLCLNLIKLDLSKNNLQFFPYLGHLHNLKFLFIHENKLGVVQLRGIFQEKQEKSHLSLNIVWATFWGNKNSFLGRHYLITETSAIAVDKNLVVHQEQCDAFLIFKSIAPFHQSTDISHLLRKKMINRHASQEQYMSELWIELKQLRKRSQMIFPILRIQKWARGWLVRNKFKKTYEDQRLNAELKQLYFGEWKKHIQRQKRLKKILKQSGREYLLVEGRQGRVRQLQVKAIKWAQEVKRKIQMKKLRFSNEIKVYNLIRQNYLTLKAIYETLRLKDSNAVYIHRNCWPNFEKHIIPMVKNVNKVKIAATPNQQYIMHACYQSFSDLNSQFVKIVHTNMKSTVYEAIKNTNTLKRGKRFTQRLNLKKIYQPFHVSTKRAIQIREHQINLSQKQRFGLQDLIKVQGTYNLLRDIIRIIYFYNISNHLTNNFNRINIFSETMLKMIVSAVRIQKTWRGYNFRKRNQKYLNVVLKMQRAAIIIQRWSRRLPIYHKKYFMITVTKQLFKIQDKTLLIEMNDYLSLVKNQIGNKRSIFVEQDCSIYLNKDSQMLCLGWNFNTSSLEVQSNIQMGKIMFSQSFFKKTVGLSEEQILAKIKYSKKMLLSDLSHLFHYQTTSNIVKKQGKNYLSVSFSTKSQAKFRFLILRLMTYSYKSNQGIKWLSYSEIGTFDIKKEIRIQIPQSRAFICNENLNLLKFCEQKLNKDNWKALLVSNKFYIKGQKKAIKMEQKFIIYTKKEQSLNQQVLKNYQVQKNQQKRFKTELSNNSFLDNRDLLRERQIYLQANQDLTQQTKIKKVFNKRSMKQFKIDKRIKHRKQTPSFILDSISINERLTTQPDYLPTYQSNMQNSNIPIEKVEKAVQRSQSRQVEIRAHKSQLKPPRRSYAEKSRILNKRKQDDNFLKKFVNIGNFIQNQFASDYRRRIKTQSQHSAIQSAQNIRKSLQRSQSQRVQQAQEKLKTIKERHSQHREIVNSYEQVSKQKSQKLKTQIREERQKRNKDKGKVKRLKVSFAQQCYPLATRSKKTDYFP